MRKLSKKGAEMTISTIVIIVLVLIVLIVLIVGFTSGWSDLWGKLTNFMVKPNVGSVVQACQTACSTSNAYDYCVLQRAVTFGDAAKDAQYKGVKLSCSSLEPMGVGLDNCENINCNQVGVTCTQIDGTWKTDCGTGTDVSTAVSSSADVSSHPSQKCCLPNCVGNHGGKVYALCPLATPKCPVASKISPPTGFKFSDDSGSVSRDCCLATIVDTAKCTA